MSLAATTAAAGDATASEAGVLLVWSERNGFTIKEQGDCTRLWLPCCATPVLPGWLLAVPRAALLGAGLVWSAYAVASEAVSLTGCWPCTAAAAAAGGIAAGADCAPEAAAASGSESCGECTNQGAYQHTVDTVLGAFCVYLLWSGRTHQRTTLQDASRNLGQHSRAYQGRPQLPAGGQNQALVVWQNGHL